MTRRKRRDGINATPPPDHTEGRGASLWLHPPVTRSSRAAIDFAFIPWQAADVASALPPGLARAFPLGDPATGAAVGLAPLAQANLSDGEERR